MKPPVIRSNIIRSNIVPSRPAAPDNTTFSPPTPKVSRMKKAKVLSPAEKAAFLAGRPDLKGK